MRKDYQKRSPFQNEYRLGESKDNESSKKIISAKEMIIGRILYLCNV